MARRPLTTTSAGGAVVAHSAASTRSAATYSAAFYGVARISLTVGFVSVALGGLVGVALGLVSGFFGGCGTA